MPRRITLLLALALWPGSTFAQTNLGLLQTTIPNPTPAGGDIFGGKVAALGNDRLLVGAEGAAEAYLFSLDGRLLATFAIPDPAAGSFGAALAAVGSDRVVIGAYNYTAGTPLAQVGRAYLFNTNAVLQATFTNPAPAAVQAFGWSVAALGADRVVISGLPNANHGAPYGGSVYLFKTNGALLAGFPNPTPAYNSGFGSTVAALGTDRVLIGAPYNNTGAAGAGAAYLFGAGGKLLMTFTNPIPATGDNFGTAVEAVGGDRLIVSAIDYGGAKGNGGAAYLFATNGTLLSTFTNPTPDRDFFGWSVAAVGNTRVLIGAYQASAGDFQDGSAYLFSTNGALLNIFHNPTPERQDWFAWSVAGVGNDRVLIGGVWDKTFAFQSGSAYLYVLSSPALSIARKGATVAVEWITAESELALQQADGLGTPLAWSNTIEPVASNGPTNLVQQPIGDGTSSRFYRLFRP